MGYDMYWRQRPQEMVDAYIAAEVEFAAAVKVRDTAHSGGSSVSLEATPEQKRVHAAYEAMRDAERYYYRLNIWGMSIARDAMGERGMLHGYGYSLGMWESVPDPTTEDPDDDPVYVAAVERVRAGSVEHPGIPAHKFGSNDGWIVTPLEIKSAMQLYVASCEETGDDPFTWLPQHADGPVEWWPEWMGWMAAAADHGGFEVW